MTEPFLRHSTASLPVIAEDDLWDAPTAEEWGRAVGRRISSYVPNAPLTPHTSEALLQLSPEQNHTESSNFNQYLQLQNIEACIMEKRNGNNVCTSDCCESLIQFWNLHLGENGQVGNLYFLPVLWHSICTSLFVDVDRLERVIGKEGFNRAQSERAYAREWACSPAGQRCALHGALILRRLEATGIGTEPPIHVPRAIFRAAIIWFCYCEFAGDTSGELLTMMSFPELDNIGVNCQQILLEANCFKSVRPKVEESRTLCALIDVLERIGHWGISRKFATILRARVSGCVNLG